MGLPVRQRYAYDEYLDLEARSPTVKHEYLDGQVWAMAGGTPDHGAIPVKIATLIDRQLGERPCRVFNSDVRVRVRATGLATYPDVSVVCGALETDPEDPKGHTITNPILVVEVLSPSTEDYDRGEKLAHYKQLASLQEIVLVAHDERRIERWRRTGDHWRLDALHGDAAVELTSISVALPLAEVYRDPLA